MYEGAGWTGLIEKEQAPCRQRCGLLGCNYMHRSVSGSSNVQAHPYHRQ